MKGRDLKDVLGRIAGAIPKDEMIRRTILDLLAEARGRGREAEQGLWMRLDEALVDYFIREDEDGYLYSDDPEDLPRWQREIAAIYGDRPITPGKGDVFARWDGKECGSLYRSPEEAADGIRATDLYRSMVPERDGYEFFEVLYKAAGHRLRIEGRPGYYDQHKNRVIDGLAVRELGNLVGGDPRD